MLTSAAHILKLERYREDEHGPCTRMARKFMKRSVCLRWFINKLQQNCWIGNKQEIEGFIIAMDAYQRHTKFVNDNILYYGGKKEDFG